jgi:endonuclease-8
MPEGDTLARAAQGLRAWLVGRTITRVDARDPALRQRAERLVGRTVDAVEARAKHLLITAGDLVVHSHMRMTGSWHVYTTGERWRYRADVMQLVIEAGDHQAVCFRAPVVRVVAARDVDALPGVSTLGPDILRDIDPQAAAQRFTALPPQTVIGDALLDQTVVSGLGNIWRCEALWEERVHPATLVARLDESTLAALVRTGAAIMGASARSAGPRRTPAVYKRTQRPCRRCGTPIVAQRIGTVNRTAYFCPNCQQTVA